MKTCGLADCVREIPEHAVLCTEHWRRVPIALQDALFKHNQMKKSRHARYDADAHRMDALRAIEHARTP